MMGKSATAEHTCENYHPIKGDENLVLGHSKDQELLVKEALHTLRGELQSRCRDGGKVLWCHSHLVWLVFEASIPTCACFVYHD